jgi:glucose-6-phosphate 1-dehydrogenase
MNQANVLVQETSSAADEIPRAASAGSLFIIFGGFGDLARRKIFPALNALVAKGVVPEGFHALAVGRRSSGAADSGLPGGAPESLARKLSSLKIDYSEKGFAELREHCVALGGGALPNLLFHLAVPPTAFGEIAAGLKRAGLVHPHGGESWSRLLLEKPFGMDGLSATRLNQSLLQSFSEDQIYRLDHYLGKPPVHLPFLLRILHPELERVWNSRHIRYVTLRSKETLGCENRSAYFDGVGILRDMVQSHLIQILALMAMDVPEDFTSAGFRREKIRALRNVKPIDLDAPSALALRGQYSAGPFEGRHVPGYHEEDGVSPGSVTETYTAIKLELAGPRWAGVPFYIESGKRMDRKETLLEIGFHDRVLGGPGENPVESPSRIIIRIQPEGTAVAEYRDGRVLELESGDYLHSEFQSLGKEGGHQDGYSVLIENALLGKSKLFLHSEEIDLAWSCLEPLIRRWSNDANAGADMIRYAPGWVGSPFSGGEAK